MFKKGDKVVMHTCGEAKHYLGKIWTCRGDEFESRSFSNVVFLTGFSGYFLCEYLQKVDIDKLQQRVDELEKYDIIDGMKYDCIGEVKMGVEFYDEENEVETEIMHTIPWIEMKEIYKMMHESRVKHMKAVDGGEG